MAANQTFQSVLQLAVALNIGFAALATIYGNSVSKEKRKIDSLFETAKIFRDLAIESNCNSDERRKTFADVVTLRNRVAEELVEYDNVLFRFMRWAAIICAVAAYAFLFVATFDPVSEVSWWVFLGSIAVNIPFISFIVYSVYRSWVTADPIRKKREELDKKLSDGLLEIIG